MSANISLLTRHITCNSLETQHHFTRALEIRFCCIVLENMVGDAGATQLAMGLEHNSRMHTLIFKSESAPSSETLRLETPFFFSECFQIDMISPVSSPRFDLQRITSETLRFKNCVLLWSTLSAFVYSISSVRKLTLLICCGA
jgi:hypothetical protein